MISTNPLIHDNYKNYYVPIEFIGSGSFGVVTKCRCKRTGKIVAVKKFNKGDDVKEIAFREIKMLQKLKHSNIVLLLDIFRNQNRIYMAMEYLPVCLMQLLESRTTGFDDVKAARMMRQLCEALSYCHSIKVIHRDIKPENVLLSADLKTVKLCDFGLARKLGGSRLTDYVSTRWYRAPELLLGDQNYNQAVDIWALGCLLIEILTKEPLFPGKSEIDQLHIIMQCMGPLIEDHRILLENNPHFKALRYLTFSDMFSKVQIPAKSLYSRFHLKISPLAMDLIQKTTIYDASKRITSSQMLSHPFLQIKQQRIEKFHRTNEQQNSTKSDRVPSQLNHLQVAKNEFLRQSNGSSARSHCSSIDEITHKHEITHKPINCNFQGQVKIPRPVKLPSIIAAGGALPSASKMFYHHHVPFSNGLQNNEGYQTHYSQNNYLPVVPMMHSRAQ